MRHVSAVSLVLVLFAAFAAFAEPSIIIFNGKVLTGDPAKPTAQAIAIEGNRILKVGSNEDLRPLATRNTRLYDAEKRLVVPGINDAHTHPAFQSPMFTIDVGMDPTWANLRTAIAAAVDETPGDIWVRASIGPTILFDPTVTAASLQQLAGTRKLVLTSFTGHGAILSTAALAALGVPANPTDPEGGWYGRDAAGSFNGRVFEYAQYPLMRKMAELATDEDLVDGIRTFAAEAIGYGITSVQAMPGVNERRFLDALKRADVPLRVRVIQFLPGDPNSAGSGVKWILDGTPIERGGALRTATYANNGGRGRENFPARDVITKAQRAHDAGQQILFHASGDKAVSVALGAFGKVRGIKRPRIEHADGLQHDLFEGAKLTGAIIVQNPSHFPFRGAYPAGEYMHSKSIVEAGIPIAIGSDGPLNPWLNMMFAVERPDLPAEALKREQVIAAYTTGSAFAEMTETQKGKIAAGMLADLAILSQNVLDVPAAELPATHSVLTVIDGKVVHSMLP